MFHAMDSSCCLIPRYLQVVCVAVSFAITGSLYAQAPATGLPQNEGAVTESSDEIDALINEDVEDERRHGPLLDPLHEIRKPWRNFWRFFDEKTGLNMGFAYTALYQGASHGNYNGNRTGGAGDLDVFGRWRIFGDDRTTGWFNGSRIGFNLEYRHNIGASTPSEIGNSVGSLWGTTSGFNEQDITLTQWWLQQKFFDERVGVRAGKLDLSTLYDVYRFGSANHFFLNEAFSDNPTIPFPGNGAAVSGFWDVDDHWTVSAAFGDAEGRKTESASVQGFDAWFSVFGARWRGKVGSMGTGVYQITGWHSDKRSGSELPTGTGFSAVAQQELGNGLVPFARYSYSSSDVVSTQHLITAGAVLEGIREHSEDRLGAAIGWGQPHDSAARSQWVGELFYRIEVMPELRVTPSVQVIANPSFNRDTDLIAVFGIRSRFTF